MTVKHSQVYPYRVWMFKTMSAIFGDAVRHIMKLPLSGGNPEVLTLGISLNSNLLDAFASLHLRDFTFSILYGYGPQIDRPDKGYISTFHLGVAKKFK